MMNFMICEIYLSITIIEISISVNLQNNRKIKKTHVSILTDELEALNEIHI